MKFVFSTILTGILLTTTAVPLAGKNAFAAPLQPAEETFSRALQQAKRVASMENEKDLPSRAFWLSRRVAKRAKLVCQQKISANQLKKKSRVIKN